MIASNTRECFTELIGQRVVGVLFNALPFGNPAVAECTTTLVLDDGSGLTFSHRQGSYWRENAEDIDLAIGEQRRRLADLKHEIEDLLSLAGYVGGET